MPIDPIQTTRLTLRAFQKADARFAISIWNDPEMGQYLPDEAMEEIDEAYLKEIEALPEDEECCYMIAELQAAHERVGTCSFIPSKDGKVYDIAYCVQESTGATATPPKWPAAWLPMRAVMARTK